MKSLTAALFFIFSWSVLACPNCHETVKAGAAGSTPPYTLIILGIFVAATYIPFYLFYRVTKKYAGHEFNEN